MTDQQNSAERGWCEIETEFITARSHVAAISDILFTMTSTRKNALEDLDEGTVSALADAIMIGTAEMDRLFYESRDVLKVDKPV